MSCAAPSFVRRHLYFRVTTSLLTVLPQLAHLALLQASISLVLILTCTNPTAPQASWPMSLGSFCAKSQTFCFPACLTPLLLLPPSSPHPLNYWSSMISCPRISQNLFLSRRRPHPIFTGLWSMWCCHQPVAGAEHAGEKQPWGQRQACHYNQGTSRHH